MNGPSDPETRAYAEGRADQFEEDKELLSWAYSKLAYRSFSEMEDCLNMDRIKLMFLEAADAPVATQAPAEPEQPVSEAEKPLYAPLREQTEAEQAAVREFAFWSGPVQGEVSRQPIIVAESRRYRWLRDQPAEVLMRFVRLSSDFWDAAIDAVMGVR